ncbi:class I adenylate-forming enzyme family protein [uncultured Endozoicomonas sp.]|uniref:class I adenylate-forming enzyme family protein n=1 Tax=uncultured Endozoicomonas sp. TaxID=432652 RepID=UPI002636B96A|nr:class I adenylate-forming enzyme family protein [uncultured Endozoicomonas sp.]
MQFIDRLSQARATLVSPGAPFELSDITTERGVCQIYKNAPQTLIDVIRAARNGDVQKEGSALFLSYMHDHWSYERFFNAVDSVAGWLHQQGIQPGQRVAIAMRNRPEWAVAFMATAMIGAVPAPLNSFGLGEELVTALSDLQPALFICDHERLNRLKAESVAPSCEVLLVGDEVEGISTYAFADVVSGYQRELPELNLTGDDPALILFTSGATSRAKVVVSSQRAVCQALFNIDYIAALSGMSSPELVGKIMAKAAPQVLLTAVPLFHVSGLHAQLLTAMRSGRRVIFMHRWDSETVIELIKTERVTQFNGAPSMVLQLLRQPEFKEVGQNLSGLGFGGAGIPSSTIEFVLDNLKDQMVGIGYGMTETNGVASAGSGDIFRHSPEAAGVVSPIMQIRTCSPEGEVLPEGETGEIQMKGAAVMDGYFSNPDATNSAFTRDGWLKTGDLGYCDEHGYLYIVDRLKDVINRAGENIAAAEVESCLMQHDEVLEAAVFGVPDEATGEAVVATVHVENTEALSPEDLKTFVASHIAAYKVPAIINLQTDALPRNPTGKILKADLKKAFQQA